MDKDEALHQEEVIGRRAADLYYNERLKGIETQLQSLVDAMTRFVRVEERLTVYLENERRTELRITSFEERMRQMELDGAGSKRSLGAIERLIWAGGTATIAFLAHWFGK